MPIEGGCFNALRLFRDIHALKGKRGVCFVIRRVVQLLFQVWRYMYAMLHNLLCVICYFLGVGARVPSRNTFPWKKGVWRNGFLIRYARRMLCSGPVGVVGGRPCFSKLWVLAMRKPRSANVTWNSKQMYVWRICLRFPFRGFANVEGARRCAAVGSTMWLFVERETAAEFALARPVVRGGQQGQPVC